MERNTIRGMLAPAERQRRRTRFRCCETDLPAAGTEPRGFAGLSGMGEERPWYDRPAEIEEAATELDDGEPAMGG